MKIFTDEYLAAVSTKEFHDRLGTLKGGQAQGLKSRRRSIKNKMYAEQARQRRSAERGAWDKAKEALEKQVADLDQARKVLQGKVASMQSQLAVLLADQDAKRGKNGH